KRGRTRAKRGLTAVSRQPEAAVSEGASEDDAPFSLLEVRGLCIEFDTEDGPVRVVDEASFDVRRGQIVGLVGESGCGKTVSSLAVLRLLSSPPAHIVGGSIRFDGRDLLEADFNEMRRIRGREIS